MPRRREQGRQGPVRAQLRAAGRPLDRLGLLARRHMPQKVTEAPASVTHRHRATTSTRFGYRTLADVLRSVRGFYVTNDRNYSYLGVRGFSRPGDYNARVLLLVDGHRLNDNVFGSALLGTEFAARPRPHRTGRDHPRPELVALRHERVLRGDQRHHQEGRGRSAASMSPAAWAASAPAAAASASARGSPTARRSCSRVPPTTSDGQHELYFPEFDTPETNFGVARDVDGDESTHFLGKFRAGGFTLAALHGSRDKTVPTASFGTVFNDPRAGTVETQQFVDAQYERTLGEPLARWRARLLRPLRLRRRLPLSWRRGGRRAGLRR